MAVDDLRDFALESITTKTFGTRSDLVGRKLKRFKSPNGGDDAFRSLRLEQHTGDTVDHRIQRSARSKRDHRPTGCLYFDLCDAEVIFGWEDCRLASGEKTMFLLI